MPNYDDPLWTIIVLAIMVLAGVWAYNRGNQQSGTHNRTYATEPEEDRHPSSQGKGAYHEESPEDRSDDRDDSYHHNRTIRVWTAVIGASGLFAVIFSAFTLDAMRGQLHVMRSQLQEMHDAGVDTKKTADAALAANKFNQKVFEANYRPWIAID